MTGDQRRKLILRSAVRTFAKSNYRAAKVAEIAAAAGVSEAMIYKHFRSKKDIFLEVLEHMSSRVLALWRSEIDVERDALTCLRNMGTTYFRRMIQHPNELKVQFQAISEINDKAIAQRLHDDHVGYMELIRQVIERGREDGTIRRDVDLEAFVFLWNGGGILMNMMRVLSFHKEFDEPLVITMLDHLLESMKA